MSTVLVLKWQDLLGQTIASCIDTGLVQSRY